MYIVPTCLALIDVREAVPVEVRDIVAQGLEDLGLHRKQIRGREIGVDVLGRDTHHEVGDSNLVAGKCRIMDGCVVRIPSDHHVLLVQGATNW